MHHGYDLRSVKVAFNNVKLALQCSLVLMLPDISQEIKVQTNTSTLGLGALLIQKTAAYASPLLHGPEVKYFRKGMLSSGMGCQEMVAVYG